MKRKLIRVYDKLLYHCNIRNISPVGVVGPFPAGCTALCITTEPKRVLQRSKERTQPTHTHSTQHTQHRERNERGTRERERRGGDFFRIAVGKSSTTRPPDVAGSYLIAVSAPIQQFMPKHTGRYSIGSILYQLGSLFL